LLKRLKSLQNNQGFMKYFKNTSWLFGEKILRMVIGLFVGIWVARYLGPEQFGLFSYAQSFVGLFAAVATLGLDGIVVRELVKDESRRDELIGTAFWLKVMGAFCVLLILAIAVNFTSNDSYTNTLVFIIASATIFQSFNVIDFYFQSKVLSRYVVYANVISLLLSSIVKVALILSDAPLMAFAWVILFDSVVLAFGFIYFYIYHSIHDISIDSKFKIQNSKFNKSIALELLRDSWPLVVLSMAAMVYAKIDQVMILEMIDAKSNGLYSASNRIYDVLVAFSPILAYSFQTALINSHQQSIEQFEKRLIMLYSFAIWTILPISIVISVNSHEIIDIVFGESYLGAGEALQIYIFCAVFAFIGGVSSRWFIIYNYQKYMTFYLILSAILNIVLNLYMIPKYGIYGASIASLISFSVSAIFSNVLTRRTYRNFELQIISFAYPIIYFLKIIKLNYLKK